MAERGLYDKFEVYDDDGDPVLNCFVLQPENDPAAVAAMQTYARTTDNDELAADLREWLRELGVAVETDDGGPGDG